MAIFDEETRKKLLEHRVIFLSTDVDGEMVDYVYQCLTVLESEGSPDVEIRIFSNGGSVRAGLDIYDAVSRYKGNTKGVVYAYARSMGAIILQACKECVCMKHAAILIHHVNSQDVSLDVIEDRLRLKELRMSMRSDQKALYSILVAKTGQTEAVIREVCRRDQDMTAIEAKKFGLVDQIEG